jgi:hypothetical protein
MIMSALRFTPRHSTIKLRPNDVLSTTTTKKPLAIMGMQQRLQHYEMRLMATSAEKRKWRRLSKVNPNLLDEEEALLRNVRNEKELELNKRSKAKNASSTSSGSNAHPFFFLVVFPVLLTGLVVLTREDLREELDQKGLVKLLKGWEK